METTLEPGDRITSRKGDRDMTLGRWTFLVAFIAGSAWAQPGEKPKISIPEPKRESMPGRGGAEFTITVVQYEISDRERDIFPLAIPELVSFFKEHTSLETQLRWNKHQLGDSRLKQASMLYMTGQDAVFQIEDKEKKNLGKYLAEGGFLFAEDIRHANPENGLTGMQAGVSGTSFDQQLKGLMRDPQVLGERGQRWQKVPQEHPLFNSYWDFPNGPPMGGAPDGNVSDLEMLQVRGRTAVIFSDLNISWYWGDPRADARERGLQFGANLIVYALTQQGINWR